MLHIWSYVQKNYRFEKHSFVEKNFLCKICMFSEVNQLNPMAGISFVVAQGYH